MKVDTFLLQSHQLSPRPTTGALSLDPTGVCHSPDPLIFAAVQNLLSVPLTFSWYFVVWITVQWLCLCRWLCIAADVWSYLVSVVLHQKHPAELRHGSSNVWLHSRHVRPAGAGLGWDTERGRRVLVLCWTNAEDVILQFTNRCRHGLSAGLWSSHLGCLCFC